MTIVTLIMTPLITIHEPPSNKERLPPIERFRRGFWKGIVGVWDTGSRVGGGV